MLGGDRGAATLNQCGPRIVYLAIEREGGKQQVSAFAMQNADQESEDIPDLPA